MDIENIRLNVGSMSNDEFEELITNIDTSFFEQHHSDIDEVLGCNEAIDAYSQLFNDIRFLKNASTNLSRFERVLHSYLKRCTSNFWVSLVPRLKKVIDECNNNKLDCSSKHVIEYIDVFKSLNQQDYSNMIKTFWEKYESVPYIFLDVTLIKPQQFPTIVLKIIDDEEVDVESIQLLIIELGYIEYLEHFLKKAKKNDLKIMIETFPSHLYQYIRPLIFGLAINPTSSQEEKKMLLQNIIDRYPVEKILQVLKEIQSIEPKNDSFSQITFFRIHILPHYLNLIQQQQQTRKRKHDDIDDINNIDNIDNEAIEILGNIKLSRTNIPRTLNDSTFIIRSEPPDNFEEARSWMHTAYQMQRPLVIRKLFEIDSENLIKSNLNEGDVSFYDNIRKRSIDLKRFLTLPNEIHEISDITKEYNIDILHQFSTELFRHSSRLEEFIDFIEFLEQNVNKNLISMILFAKTVASNKFYYEMDNLQKDEFDTFTLIVSGNVTHTISTLETKKEIDDLLPPKRKLSNHYTSIDKLTKDNIKIRSFFDTVKLYAGDVIYIPHKNYRIMTQDKGSLSYSLIYNPNPNI